MDRCLFNIPLLETSTDSDGRKIRAEDALETVGNAVRAMPDHTFHVAAYAVHESSNGPVMVLELHAPASAPMKCAELAYALCSSLRRGTIAWGRIDARGCIVYAQFNGPALTLWSNFTPEHFLLLDGSKAH